MIFSSPLFLAGGGWEVLDSLKPLLERDLE